MSPRGAQKTGGRRVRSTRRDPRRISRELSTRTTVLVVGEGQTERHYFYELSNKVRDKKKYAVTAKCGPGSPTKTVQCAIDLKNPDKFDEIWCVLDVEGRGNRKSLDQAIKLARDNDIKLILSNPSFEVWLLAHFERKAKSYNDSNAVIDQQLNKHWKKQFQQKYQKADDQIYDRVASYTKTAIENAKWVRETHHQSEDNTADCNSSTEVYRLVKKLLG